MTRISIELVPRSFEGLEEECLSLKRTYPHLDTLNIPDLLRMPIRSWDACRCLSKIIPRSIPHLRSMDFDLSKGSVATEAISDFLEVLVVSGDPPQDFSRPVYGTSSTELIRHLRETYPKMTIYAAVDPYRSGIREEMEYVKRKKDAGANGFFTQPFFSMNLLEVFRDLLLNEKIFWGVSPVVGGKSKNYWESTNNAVFPSDYDFSFEGNQKFARDVFTFATATETDIYFMPIRMNVLKYLNGIFHGVRQDQSS